VELRFLLDTNICIYIRKRRPESVLGRFLDLAPGEAAISIITYGELLYGANRSVHRSAALERVREFARILPALSLPESAAEIYAAIRCELESKGEVIGTHDLWIAAHALASGLILVTNNETEFRRVRGLKIQNWTV
jgi:tRNA(fMet)-specific endonuclease VapC